MAEPIKLPPLPSAKLEIINLIDVLITLIAFFMLTAVFAEKSHRLNIQLPAAGHQSAAARQNRAAVRIEIGIDKEGRIYLDGKPVSAAELAGQLRRQSNDTVVVIRADKECRYGGIVKVLDEVKSCHLSKVALEVREL